MRIDINPYIVADSEICHGKPTFKGTRVMVWQVLEMLEAGADVKDIKKAFPAITSAAVRAALHYAADLVRGGDNVIVKIPSA